MLTEDRHLGLALPACRGPPPDRTHTNLRYTRPEFADVVRPGATQDINRCLMMAANGCIQNAAHVPDSVHYLVGPACLVRAACRF